MVSLGLVDWGLLAALALIAVYSYLAWSFDYWKRKGVPYARPRLLFGNMKEFVLGRKSVGRVYQDIYWELDGHPFGGYFKLGQPSLMIRDPDLVKVVSVQEFPSFHDNDFVVYVHCDPLFGRNPFVLRGEAWKAVRSPLTAGFTVQKVKAWFLEMVQVSKNMNTYLNTHAPKGPLNCKDMVGSFALDIVACCAYGLDGTALVNPHSEFAEIGRVFLAPSIRQGVEQMIIMLFPRLAGFLNIGITKKEVTQFFQRVMKEAVTYRQKNNVKKNDFLQLLISLKEKSQGKKVVNWYDEFTDDDIAAHCMTFFFDGYETSSNSLMYTLYELAVNPDVQRKLTEEIVASLEKTNGEITYEGILEMKYLDMVFKESVRKYPSVPFIGRICTKPFQLVASNGLSCRVEPGTPVLTPTLGIHHDPKYYPEPQRFDPDRFTEENVQKRHRYAFLPFGEGPRQCLGTRFGEALVKCGVVSILAHYEILPTDKTPKELSHSPQAFIFVTDDEVWLQFRKRS